MTKFEFIFFISVWNFSNLRGKILEFLPRTKILPFLVAILPKFTK